VLIALHHPPVADVQTRLRVDHNPRPNEIALRDYLGEAARTSRARFVVVAGHIHNYERFFQQDVVYLDLVSGGGGAIPYQVDRTDADLYKTRDFPNYHYLKLTISDGSWMGRCIAWTHRRPRALPSRSRTASRCNRATLVEESAGSDLLAGTWQLASPLVAHLLRRTYMTETPRGM
jgi:hypothetical protein